MRETDIAGNNSRRRLSPQRSMAIKRVWWFSDSQTAGQARDYRCNPALLPCGCS